MIPNITRRAFLRATFGVVAAGAAGCSSLGGKQTTWHPLPLVQDGNVHPDWVHLGYGGFSVDNGTLRTECDPRGLGLLVYSKEKFGDCRIRVVFRTQTAKSNSGVYIRLADGVLKQVGNPGPGFDRDASGKPSAQSMDAVKAAAEKEIGAWFGVHRGYEVQIDAGGDTWHRTGAIYSLAPATAAPAKDPTDWHTMIITLRGEAVDVELDGVHVTTFDAASTNLPPRKEWYEPKREPKRPIHGYIGLQNHDPGDVVWFREISVLDL